MELARNSTQRVAVSAATVVAVVVLIGSVALISRDFGFRAAALLGPALALPVFFAIHLQFQRSTVQRRDVAFLVVVFCVTCGGSLFVVRTWYDSGFHRDHAEDVRWAEFKRRIGRELAFHDVHIHKTNRKNIYWASGTVDSTTDLERLHALASECGIAGRRLDGPYAHSISLVVRGQTRESE